MRRDLGAPLVRALTVTPSNSVNEAKLVNGAVTRAKLGGAAVTAGKLAAGSVRTARGTRSACS